MGTLPVITFRQCSFEVWTKDRRPWLVTAPMLLSSWKSLLFRLAPPYATTTNIKFVFFHLDFSLDASQILSISINMAEVECLISAPVSARQTGFLAFF